jgi:glycosyltransferase involved in cell wall biosynthesis
MLDFTVAIPTYNGEQRLPEVLECLRSQINVESLAWEVLVIDNNSSDRTADLVQRYQADFPVPIRYYLELEQGAAFARKRAIRESQSELIGFLDDDNLPAPNWVSAAYQFGQTHPNAGAYGSRITGAFEVEPPHNFQRLLPYLAITQRGANPLCYHRHRKILPPSAGLVVRKQAWLSCVPEQTILGGRTPGSMLTGEDTEVMARIHQSTWDVWYNPAMELTHKIPKERLERAYLIPFFQGIGLGRYVTRMLSVAPTHRPLMLWVYMANDLRKIVLHVLKHRRTLSTDLVAACELALYVNSLISPVYLYTKGYLKGKSFN